MVIVILLAATVLVRSFDQEHSQTNRSGKIPITFHAPAFCRSGMGTAGKPTNRTCKSRRTKIRQTPRGSRALPRKADHSSI